MKASKEQQDLLLRIAREDMHSHTAAAEPVAEQAEVDRLRAERSAARDAAAASTMSEHDAVREVDRLRREKSRLQRREKADIQALSSLTDTESRRDAEHDLLSTQRRIESIERDLAEAERVLEARRLHNQSIGANTDALDQRIAAAERARDAAATASLNAAATKREHIDSLKAQLEPQLLAEYERQREDYGVGAALFAGRSCGGCHLILPPAEISAIRSTPADQIPTCPECGTFLIRA